MDIIRGRKRCRDEAAASVDELPLISRVYGKHGIYPRMPQNTTVEAKDYSVDDSCILRNFPKQKSSDLRFLAWVAYTRKFSDSSITDIERRTCPLLWCREIFPSEDAMHKHVYTCEYLSKGLYWCFHCQKPERVGKFQCKKCQGTMSTADRITTVAKKIFSGLGVRKTMGDTSTPAAHRNIHSPNTPEALLYPSKSEKGAQFEETMTDTSECNYMELPNNTISEMEGEYIFEIGADWAGPSQELPDSSVAEMTGSEFTPMPSLPYTVEKASHDSWDLSMCSVSPASTYVASSSRPSQPIPLRLDTCITEPLRQHYLQPDTSAMLSPLSPSDRIESGIFTVSPTDSVVSGRSMFSNSECSSATTVSSSWDESSNSLGWGNDFRFPTSFPASIGRFPSKASDKLPRDEQSLAYIPQILPVTLPENLERHPSNSSSSSAEHLENRCTTSERRQTLSTRWVDAKDLVKSFSEVLEEHIEHSRQALNKMPPSSNLTELLALSPSSIQSVGFEVLESLLEGQNPSSLVHIFAFTNVAYSMAVAVDRDESKVQTEQWFRNCLSWSTLLSFKDDRRMYEQIACAIWQPQSATTSQSGSFLLSSMERENKLVTACKHFLDLIQSLGDHEKSNPIPREQFDFARSSFVHNAKTRVIDKLIQKPSIEAFIEDVVNVENRLNNNIIANIRQLELELICTAKLSSQSNNAYSRFISHVTDLCDTMYADEISTKSRTAHHIEAIALTNRLLRMAKHPNSEVHKPEFNIDLLLDRHDFVPQLMFDDIDAPLSDFPRDIDAFLDESFDFTPFEFTSQTTPLQRSFSFQQTVIPSEPALPPHPSSTVSADTKSHLPAATKFRCQYCGYVPTGEERWKPSNLSRHKRIQHPEKGGKGGKVYKCQWEGCGSTFTRSDNLKEHVRKKGHEVWGGGDDKGSSEGESKPKKRKEMKAMMDTGLR